jgi:hypothetical protein
MRTCSSAGWTRMWPSNPRVLGSNSGGLTPIPFAKAVRSRQIPPCPRHWLSGLAVISRPSGEHGLAHETGREVVLRRLRRVRAQPFARLSPVDDESASQISRR